MQEENDKSHLPLTQAEGEGEGEGLWWATSETLEEGRTHTQVKVWCDDKIYPTTKNNSNDKKDIRDIAWWQS